MSQETATERMVRQAAERQAAAVAEKAQNVADQAAAVDPKIAESRALQEKQEADADLAARQAAAAELLKGTQLTGGVPGVTSNAAGAQAPLSPQIAQLTRTDSIPLAAVDSSMDNSQIATERPWKTFQHLYANANTIMPSGKKLIFGGQNGHVGTYSTNVPAQIEHLLELALTPGSMVSEVKRDNEGRYIVVTDAILQAETLAALTDSRTNTARQQDPNVAQAMNNLGRTIAQDS